ncbi:transposase [Kocuria flava]|uniref:transposase n=1 Tax=Kocuria flava TaxID=446860 RepID=UPI001F340927|nr:transposase [Kocuria flava]
MRWRPSRPGTPHRQADHPPEREAGGRGPAPRGDPGLALLPEAASRLPRPFRAGTPARRRGPRRIPHLPIPETVRLGRTLRRWRAAILAYFDTAGASNGPTEAINGVIETMCRVARGFRNFDNYRLRVLLTSGGHRPRRKAPTHAHPRRAVLSDFFSSPSLMNPPP